MYFCNVNHSLHLKGDWFFFRILVYLANVPIKRTDISVESVNCILVILKWQILLSLVCGKYISMYTDFPRKLPQFTRKKMFNPLSCFDLLLMAIMPFGKTRKMENKLIARLLYARHHVTHFVCTFQRNPGDTSAR